MKSLLVGLIILTFIPLHPATFILKHRAEVSDGLVKVKDIARLETSTPKKLGNITISVSPDLGATRVIKKQEFYRKLVGNGVNNPIIKGPSVVRVRRVGAVIDTNLFKKKILSYIIAHSKWKKGVTVNIVSSKEIVVPRHGVRWQIAPADGEDFFGNVLFKIKAYSKQEQIFNSWLVARLKIEQKVAVSNRTISKNEPLTETDFRWETREITPFTKDAILTPNELLGQKPGRIIRPNTVITQRVMQKKFLVRRGEQATLVAQRPFIKATSRVMVLKNGAYGDLVKVQNTVSKKILTATVKGKNHLEVTVQ